MARPFGGARVPAIGQGTWNMERDDRAACVAALRRGVELGLTHVDTAEMYGRGRVEEIVRDALADTLKSARDSVFLVSKVLPQNASRTGTVKALDATLKRLGTDHVDAYLLHWRGRIALDESIEALLACQKAGKTRSIGVSNFDADDVNEACALAGPGRIACNQVLYHLGERAIEHDVIGACRAHDVAVVAYSPFGSGAFRAHAALTAVARKHGASERAVALAFLVRDPIVSAIPKAAAVAHVEDNARALTLTLDDDDIARIDAAFPRGQRARTLPTI